MNTDNKPQITQSVYDALETVRTTGVTNMFDVKTVLHILKVLGAEEARSWVKNNGNDYARGIMHGFTIIE